MAPRRARALQALAERPEKRQRTEFPAGPADGGENEETDTRAGDPRAKTQMTKRGTVHAT